MKKKALIWVLGIVIVLIINNVILWIVLVSQNNQVNIVLREEITPNLINENIDILCPRLCEERGYDGWQGTGGSIESQTTSCDCYWLVISVPSERVNN